MSKRCLSQSPCIYRIEDKCVFDKNEHCDYREVKPKKWAVVITNSIDNEYTCKLFRKHKKAGEFLTDMLNAEINHVKTTYGYEPTVRRAKDNITLYYDEDERVDDLPDGTVANVEQMEFRIMKITK